MTDALVRICPDSASLVQAVAAHFLTLSAQAIRSRGRFSVALSGGSSPRPVYEQLATEELASRVDWAHVHVFWGDERCVPPDHPDSNYGMARETLLDHVPIPSRNVHRIHGEWDPPEAALAYEDTLRGFFRPDVQQAAPTFDLVLLGMGADGHTASLFPGTPALHETNRWVVSHCVHAVDAWRVTLTATAINAAAQVTFVVSGAEKAETVQRVLAGPHQPESLPAQTVKPVSGRLLWLVDTAAAALLGRNRQQEVAIKGSSLVPMMTDDCDAPVEPLTTALSRRGRTKRRRDKERRDDTEAR